MGQFSNGPIRQAPSKEETSANETSASANCAELAGFFVLRNEWTTIPAATKAASEFASVRASCWLPVVGWTMEKNATTRAQPTIAMAGALFVNTWITVATRAVGHARTSAL